MLGEHSGSGRRDGGLTHKQRTKMLPSPFGFGISADDGFLLQVELDFDPCSGALAGLISGAAAFANQTFKSQFPSFAFIGLHKVRQAGRSD